jgi:hypothetical protein
LESEDPVEFLSSSWEAVGEDGMAHRRLRRVWVVCQGALLEGAAVEILMGSLSDLMPPRVVELASTAEEAVG